MKVLISGIYTPWDFLASITHSLASTITLDDSSIICITDNSDESDREDSHRRELAREFA